MWQQIFEHQGIQRKFGIFFRNLFSKNMKANFYFLQNYENRWRFYIFLSVSIIKIATIITLNATNFFARGSRERAAPIFQFNLFKKKIIMVETFLPLLNSPDKVQWRALQLYLLNLANKWRNEIFLMIRGGECGVSQLTTKKTSKS